MPVVIVTPRDILVAVVVLVATAVSTRGEDDVIGMHSYIERRMEIRSSIGG